MPTVIYFVRFSRRSGPVSVMTRCISFMQSTGTPFRYRHSANVRKSARRRSRRVLRNALNRRRSATRSPGDAACGGSANECRHPRCVVNCGFAPSRKWGHSLSSRTRRAMTHGHVAFSTGLDKLAVCHVGCVQRPVLGPSGGES